MDSRATLYETLISKPRHPWVMLGGALVLLSIPLVGVFLEVALGLSPINNHWRAMLVAPITILYILVIAPRFERVGTSVKNALRPVVLVDDPTYDRIILSAGHVSRRNELLSFGAGVVVAIALTDWRSGESFHWLSLYWLIASCLMYGLLSWTIYVAIATSRATGALLRQPLLVDPLNITPFEPVGRQSLLMALVFVGGVVLGMLISVSEFKFWLEPSFWVVNMTIVVVPIIIFFLKMRPTHDVLAAARTKELTAVRGHIRRASTAFLERLEGGQDTGLLAQEISALSVLEQRLQGAQTWPYNVAMLRTLFISVLVPFFTMVGKFVLDQLLA